MTTGVSMLAAEELPSAITSGPAGESPTRLWSDGQDVPQLGTRIQHRADARAEQAAENPAWRRRGPHSTTPHAAQNATIELRHWIATDTLRRTLPQRESASDDRQSLIDEVASQVLRRLQASWPGGGKETEERDNDLVFVICSFDPDMDPVFDAIAAAAASAGLRAVRVKDVHGDYRISEKILVLVQAARFIVADLSRERPNVYFELGYARGLGKTVITILRAGTIAHFDVQDWAYLEYIDSRPLEQHLRERFRHELPPAQAR